MKIPEKKNIMIDNLKGFTLIELLVVIAIIGILSSIVVLSLSGSTAKARAAKATNDLSQMMMAIEMARSDGSTLTEWPVTTVGPACPGSSNDTIKSATTTYMKLNCPSSDYTYTISGIVSGLNYDNYSFSAEFPDGGTFTCSGGVCVCSSGTLCKK